MRSRPTELGTILGLTALLGWLPITISWLIAEVALANGASAWPDWLFAWGMAAIWLTLVGLGAWIYAVWFGN